jgi:hypothetical protein
MWKAHISPWIGVSVRRYRYAEVIRRVFGSPEISQKKYTSVLFCSFLDSVVTCFPWGVFYVLSNAAGRRFVLAGLEDDPWILGALLARTMVFKYGYIVYRVRRL